MTANYSKPGLTDREILLMRMADFASFQPLAIAALRKCGEPITPQNILLVQESLAVEKRIVPPHWTGWVDCVECGIRPAEAEHRGESVRVCRWCDHPEWIESGEGMDFWWTAVCNRYQAMIGV